VSLFKGFEDARTFSADTVVETDLCVVGAGAAGITLANEFANHGLRVCLLEAGGLSIDPMVTAASEVVSVGREYDVAATRLRLFGGTTNHWGGHCVPLEPDDFEAKSWIPDSGWPITYSDILPYYRRAYDVLDLEDFGRPAEEISRELGMKLMSFDSSFFRTQMSRYNRVRFGFQFGENLEAADNIRVILYSDVCEFRLASSETDIVSELEASSPSKNKFRVRARIFVMAAGGIENARLLLLSDSERPAGLGNQNDAVGRYFSEHLWYPSGLFAPFDDRNVLPLYYREVAYKNSAVRCHLVLTSEASEKLQIGRYRSELRFQSIVPEAASRMRAGEFDAHDLISLLVSPVAAGKAAKCIAKTQADFFRLLNFVEQVPNPGSRVFLGDRHDAYGRRQAQIDWRLSDIDQATVTAPQDLLAMEAGKARFGRVRIDIKKDPEMILEGVTGGSHHTGTTRMTDNPKKGVVDSNCRVHGTQNLFIAGSSVFPTNGYPNPTLTIVALALRLSDHIKAIAFRD